MSRTLVVEADGGSRGNPGPAASGSAVIDAVTGDVLVEVGRYLGIATNNVAEYHGLLEGVRRAPGHRPGGPAAGADGLEARRRADVGALEDQASGHGSAGRRGAGRACRNRRDVRMGAAASELARRRAGEPGAGCEGGCRGYRCRGCTNHRGGGRQRVQLSAELGELLEAEALLRGSGADRATLESLLHPEFWLVDASGATHTRDEALDSLMGSARPPFEPDGCREPRTGIRPVPVELRAHPRRCGHPPVLAVATGPPPGGSSSSTRPPRSCRPLATLTPFHGVSVSGTPTSQSGRWVGTGSP